MKFAKSIKHWLLIACSLSTIIVGTIPFNKHLNLNSNYNQELIANPSNKINLSSNQNLQDIIGGNIDPYFITSGVLQDFILNYLFIQVSDAKEVPGSTESFINKLEHSLNSTGSEHDQIIKQFSPWEQKLLAGTNIKVDLTTGQLSPDTSAATWTNIFSDGFDTSLAGNIKSNEADFSKNMESVINILYPNNTGLNIDNFSSFVDPTETTPIAKFNNLFNSNDYTDVAPIAAAFINGIFDIKEPQKQDIAKFWQPKINSYFANIKEFFYFISFAKNLHDQVIQNKGYDKYPAFFYQIFLKYQPVPNLGFAAIPLFNGSSTFWPFKSTTDFFDILNNNWSAKNSPLQNNLIWLRLVYQKIFNFSNAGNIQTNTITFLDSLTAYYTNTFPDQYNNFLKTQNIIDNSVKDQSSYIFNFFKSDFMDKIADNNKNALDYMLNTMLEPLNNIPSEQAFVLLARTRINNIILNLDSNETGWAVTLYSDINSSLWKEYKNIRDELIFNNIPIPQDPWEKKPSSVTGIFSWTLFVIFLIVAILIFYYIGIKIYEHKKIKKIKIAKTIKTDEDRDKFY